MKSLDGTEYELVYSSKVNGPNQVKGLSFGCTYLYYKPTTSNSWKRSEFRNQLQLITYIKNHRDEDLK